MPQTLSRIVGFVVTFLSVASAALGQEPSKEPVPTVAPQAPLPAAERSPKDAYHCRDTAGATYKIRLTAETKAVIISKGGFTRILPLSEPNAELTRREPGSPVVFSGWNASGASPMERLDLSTEVVNHYGLKGGTTVGTVSLFIEHKEPPGLDCKPVGYAVKIVTNDPTSLLDRIVRPFMDAVENRARDGALKPVGILGAEAMVKRYTSSPLGKKSGSTDALLRVVSPSLKKLDAASLKEIAKRLRPAEKSFWDGLIAGSGHREVAGSPSN